MPVITIVTNEALARDKKVALGDGVTELFASEVHVPPGHVHVLIQDNQFFTFGKDVQSPAVYVTVRSSAQQVGPEARRNLVADMVPLLQAALPELDAIRICTMFEELPVECIAVGAHIATFKKGSGAGGSKAGSRGGSHGGAPAQPAAAAVAAADAAVAAAEQEH